MLIENPGVVLPVLFLICLAGAGICLYILIRFFRNRGRPSGQSTPRRERQARPSAHHRLIAWLSEPVARDSQAAVQGEHQTPGTQVQSGQLGGERITDADEVFRVLRKGPGGELVVEVDGHAYRRLADIHDGVTGRRVVLAIQELIQFAGPYGERVLSDISPKLTPAPESQQVEDELDDAQRDFLRGLQQDVGNDPDLSQRPSLVGALRRGLRRRERDPEGSEALEEPRTLVDELEDSLQKRLGAMPAFAGRSIHFREGVGGTVEFEVDEVRYTSMEDIPDPSIPRLIQDTIREWDA